MRSFALLVFLLLGVAGVSGPALAAGDAPAAAQSGADDMRTTAHSLLMKSRDLITDALSETQKATGMTNDQLYGVGVGIVTGLIVADWIGTGGVATLAVVGVGGLLGNWAAAAK